MWATSKTWNHEIWHHSSWKIVHSIREGYCQHLTMKSASVYKQNIKFNNYQIINTAFISITCSRNCMTFTIVTRLVLLYITADLRIDLAYLNGSLCRLLREGGFQHDCCVSAPRLSFNRSILSVGWYLEMLNNNLIVLNMILYHIRFQS